MNLGRYFFGTLLCVFLSLCLGTPTFASETPRSECTELLTGVRLLSSSAHPEIPWGRFTVHDLIPALRVSIEEYRSALDRIAANPKPPTAENTFLAEEEASEAIYKIQAIYYNEWLTNSSPEILALREEFAELLSSWEEFRSSHAGYLERARALGEPLEAAMEKSRGTLELGLSDQIAYSHYLGLKLDGAYLPTARKNRLFEIHRRLGVAQADFVRNGILARESIRLRITDVSELEGLSAESIERARKYGEKEGLYLIPVNDKVLVGEIQTRARSRELRRKLWYARTPKEVASQFITAEEAGEAWKHSNEALIHEINELNRQLATLLGQPSFAHYQLDSQMIPGPAGVQKFFDQLVPRVLRTAKAQKRELERFARKLDGIDRLEEWDVPYYSQKLMKATFGFDDQDLAEYFELGTTLENMMRYAEKRFPIRFVQRDGAPSYHPDNTVYEVYDTRTQKKISEIHLDPLRRPGKQFFQGWEYLFRSRGVGSQGELPATMAVSMNIEPAVDGGPVLLDFEKGVQLAFHEFVGHALHESSDISKIPGLAGTQGVFADGVETPSMIAEEFARDPLFLRMATHHKTGKPLPEKWIRIITEELPKFQQGLKLLADSRTLTKAYLDLHLGLDPPSPEESLVDYERRKVGNLNLFPDSPHAPMANEFLHHFGGGMECLYFSYLTGAIKGAFVAEFLFRQEYNQPMKFMNYWDYVLATSGRESDINFLIEQFTGEKISLKAYFERYGF